MDRETDVTYKARANFSDLTAAVAKAQAEIAALRKEEEAANKASTFENMQKNRYEPQFIQSGDAFSFVLPRGTELNPIH